MSAFPCPFCDLGFDSKGMLQMHVRRCHLEPDDAENATSPRQTGSLTPCHACPQAVQQRCLLASRDNLDRLAYDFARGERVYQ